MTNRLDEADALCDDLGEIFCLTFIRGVDPTEALRRMGAYSDTFTRLDHHDMLERYMSFDAGYPQMAGAVDLGEWTVVLEPFGFEGAGTLLTAVSQGTDALSVLCHDYAHPHFVYARNGVVVTEFKPEWMGHGVWGAEPDLLSPHLHTVGLDPVDPEGDVELTDRGEARAVLLAGLVTGVLPAREVMAAPMLAAQIEPWFTGAAPSENALRQDRWNQNPYRTALIDAVAGATAAAKRAAAVAQVRRLADDLGLRGAPGLAEALADAEAGRAHAVPPTSPLGQAVRGWLRLASLANWSLNDHPQRLTEAERRHGYALGGFAHALRAALWPDPDLAVRTVLEPLASGREPSVDAAAVAAALSRLRT